MDTLDESISFYDLENTFTIYESELEETGFNLSPYQIESINQLNGYVESQYDDQSPEFIQALLPILSQVLPQVLPHILPAAIGLLPQAASALGNIVSGLTGGGNRGAAPMRVPVLDGIAARGTPRQTAQRQSQPQAYNSGIYPSVNNTLNSLLSMLQNPQVMNLLSNLASGLAQNSVVTPAGNNVPAQTVLNSISTLSGNAANTVPASAPIIASPPVAPIAPLNNMPVGSEYLSEQDAIEVARMFS